MKKESLLCSVTLQHDSAGEKGNSVRPSVRQGGSTGSQKIFFKYCLFISITISLCFGLSLKLLDLLLFNSVYTTANAQLKRVWESSKTAALTLILTVSLSTDL